MSKAYFMGIDTGTNSSKGVIMDDCGQILAVHSTQHEMTNPKPGHYEHDAEKDWWGDFCTISKALIAKTGIDPKDIEQTADKLRAQAQCASQRISEELRRLDDDFRTGFKKVESLADEAVKGMGIDTDELSRKFEDNFDKVSEKALDVAISAGAELKKALAQAKLQMDALRAKYKK